MSAPDATVTTVTTVDAPASHDGVIDEPGPRARAVLWFVAVATVCLGLAWTLFVLGMLAFQPAEPKGAVTAGELIAVEGALLAALVSLFVVRRS